MITPSIVLRLVQLLLLIPTIYNNALLPYFQGDEDNDDSIRHLRLIIVDSVAGVISPILGGQQIHGTVHHYFIVVTVFVVIIQSKN